VHIRIAGLTIQIAWTEPDLQGLRVAPAGAAVPFLVDAAPADVRIDLVARVLDDDDGARECLFDSGGSWRLYRHDEGFLFRFFSSAFGPVPYKTAHFTPDFSCGRVTLNRAFFANAATVDPLEYPLDELLVISLLARERGLELHACGLVDGPTGYLFVGQSGAGKSTIARLWQDEGHAAILSDDRIVVRREPDGLWMYGTPWHGEAPLASPRRARIDAVFFLSHHAHDEALELRRAAAVTRLFAASFPPFHDSRALEFSLAFLESLVLRTPCFELRFAPTPAILQLVRDTAGGDRGVPL
jgi:hypothetical protein